MGLFNNIIKFLADKIVKTKYQKYFDDLHNDPEYQKALVEIKKAPERIEKAGIAAVKAQEKFKKEYDAFAKKYGKERADAIVAQTRAGTYNPTWSIKTIKDGVNNITQCKWCSKGFKNSFEKYSDFCSLKCEHDYNQYIDNK